MPAHGDLADPDDLSLMEEQKMVMTTDLKAGAAKDRPSHKSSFKKTGKTEQILGYKAEQWAFIDEETHDQLDIWATKDLKGSFHLFEGGSPMGAKQGPSSCSVNSQRRATTR